MRIKVQGGPAVPVHGKVTRYLVSALEHRNRHKLNAQLQTPFVAFPTLRPNGEPLLLYPLPCQKGGHGHGDVADEVGLHVILVFDLEQKVTGVVAYLRKKKQETWLFFDEVI